MNLGDVRVEQPPLPFDAENGRPNPYAMDTSDDEVRRALMAAWEDSR